MSTEAENDLKNLRAFYNAFDNLAKIEFKTPHGLEVQNTFSEAVNEIIKPYLIQKGNIIKNETTNPQSNEQ